MRPSAGGNAALVLAAALLAAVPDSAASADDTAPTADASSTLVPGPGADLVAAHCGACHSLALVTQNRGDAAHWTGLIRWMQAKHNLWDLGPAEADIVAYLAAHYGAETPSTRRAPLDTRWRDGED